MSTEREYDADEQAAWEQAVRAEIVRLGHDPDELEANAGGFGQDFMEYRDDTTGYAAMIVLDE